MSPSQPNQTHHRQESSEGLDLGHGRGPTSVMDRGIDANATDHSWSTVEEKRLDEDLKKENYWRRWGPYLSERQWVSRQIELGFCKL